MTKWTIALTLLGAVVLVRAQNPPPQRGASGLTAPGFHHLHLRSTDPDAAIGFYTRQFPSTSASVFAGAPALRSGNVLVLFTKVKEPPKTAPQTAIWHFGWHVVDVRANYARYMQSREVKLLPLYTGEGDAFVYVSSDALPGTGGVLGLTKAQMAEARAKGIKPAGGAGFAYLQGPDSAIIEYQGNMPRERFNHVHMYEEEPYCAQNWYMTHLRAGLREAMEIRPDSNCKAARSEKSWPALEKEGMVRIPVGGVTFDDVGLFFYANPGTSPLAPTRGQLYDHLGLSVTDLDAWMKKLRAEGVTFLTKPYKLGDSRAVMIEGPSREAIELVEVKK